MHLRRKSLISRVLLKSTPWLAAGTLLGAGPVHAVEGKAWVGVMLQELSEPLREALNLEAGVDGVVIAGVVPGSPADKAGLEEGDLIQSVDGRDVKTVEELMDRVRTKKVGEPSKFSVQREGDVRTVTVTLGTREADDDTPAPTPDPRRAPRGAVPQANPGQPTSPVPPDMDEDHTWFEEETPGPERHRGMMRRFGPGMDASDRGYLGVTTIDLGEQLAAYFEVTPERGVLVKEVAKDSPAATAGLRAGDIILTLNKSGVESPGDLLRLVRAHDPQDQVEIEVKRKGTTVTLNAILGKTEGLSEWWPGPRRGFGWNMERLPQRLQLLGEHLEHLKMLDSEHLEHMMEFHKEHPDRRVRVVHRGSGVEI